MMDLFRKLKARIIAIEERLIALETRTENKILPRRTTTPAPSEVLTNIKVD